MERMILCAHLWAKSRHHPSGLIVPETALHEPGASKRTQSAHFAPLFGCALYWTSFGSALSAPYAVVARQIALVMSSARPPRMAARREMCEPRAFLSIVDSLSSSSSVPNRWAPRGHQ